MKKKTAKRMISFAMALMMALTSVMIGGVETKAEETVTTIELQDADFDAGWNTSVWTYSPTDWEGTTAIKDATRDNATVKVFEFWRDGSGDVTVSQKVAALDAGTYKVSIEATGKNASVKLKLGDSVSDTALSIADNYTAWNTLTDTFTLAEDATNVEVGFLLSATAGGAQVDKLILEKVTQSATLPPAESFDPAEHSFDVSVSADNSSVTVGEKITLTAKVLMDGVEVTNLAEKNLRVGFFHNTTSGKQNATYVKDAGTSFAAEITLNEAGDFYFTAKVYYVDPDTNVWTDSLKNSSGNNAEAYITLTGKASDTDTDTDTDIDTNTNTNTNTDTTTSTTEKPVAIELENASFKDAITDDGAWKGETKSGKYDEVGNMYLSYAYADNSWLQKPDGAGTHCLKFDVNHADEITIYQWVDDLKAGKYTFTMPIMGENIDVYFVIGDKTVKATSLAGGNNWITAKGVITLSEDVASEKVGFKLVATGDSDEYNWGYIDRIELTRGIPKTGDSTNVYAYVMLMMAGLVMIGYSVKRNKA